MHKKILLVSSEAVPFAKSGGLGDMVSALAIALSELGHDVRIIMPRYYHINPMTLTKHNEAFAVPFGWGEVWCGLYEGILPGSKVPVYFLNYEEYFGRNGIYGSDASSSFADNFARFTLLSRGSFSICRLLQWIPDIMHSHDWPTALVSVYLKTWERYGDFAHTASIFTIHNLGYQGWFGRDQLYYAQVNQNDFYEQGLEALGAINLMKAGITTSDIITTVSPTYAKEIQGYEYGEGQDWLLRQRSAQLEGILNGVDTTVWNPSTDKHIAPYFYSVKDMSNKAKLKAKLQEKMALPMRDNQPLVAMVTRLVAQKGVELLLGDWGVLARLMHYHPSTQVVIVGTGESALEQCLLEMSYRYPQNIAVKIGFDEPLSHLVEAGADFFLMPSRYEPCGLNQMYSLLYGTLPIVRRTGGLADTVKEYNEQSSEGTGWLFNDYNVDGCWWALNYAIETYHQRPEHIEKMRKRAMQEDFSWHKSAILYDTVYMKALEYRSAGK